MGKGLAIRRPWAWAIVEGFKDVENGRSQTSYRGPLFVHAGLREDHLGWLALDRMGIDFPEEVRSRAPRTSETASNESSANGSSRMLATSLWTLSYPAARSAASVFAKPRSETAPVPRLRCYPAFTCSAIMCPSAVRKYCSPAYPGVTRMPADIFGNCSEWASSFPVAASRHTTCSVE